MGNWLGGYLINKGARFSRNSNFVFRKIVDEFILVPIHQDVADLECIYTLNEVGAFIWEQLETPASWTDLTTALNKEYDADPEVLEADLEEFLEEMTSIDAIKGV